MIKIMILEDDEECSKILHNYVNKYFDTNKINFELKIYNNAKDFIDNCKDDTDILLMDIEMPGINGMEAAKIIREKNKKVIIIFVTNLAQYAIEGYQVQAYDFILKPIRYKSFSMKLNRICNQLEHKRKDISINVNYKGEIIKLYIVDILYIEIQNHDAIIHTFNENIKLRATLHSFISMLSDKHFTLCNASYLVNLAYVTKIDKENVFIENIKIHISQPKRKIFLQEVGRYLGGSI